eukprot:CAMPEP_0201529054 /NCGR_PEP_ID=MMETSP0161_2-20130828/40452_1 /ASSEMBLY_ACC=CAM_ASM_000251 /TAXON_ID=180227 /ORGANISM="Neoparamoeba aestuarina, Strain SoJaBio B1-5/56/2" /LENGTH=252 /DNA_ID=CAMNT_0047930665 /DNA_START=434 /DNA_END=1192 /DNA_ORIENTATION=+
MAAEPTQEELKTCAECIVVLQKTVNDTTLECNREESSVRLVAVSKLKDYTLIQSCYDAGQRHFGENYVQEMVDKAGKLPKDIQWHFIGTLQRNKVKILLKGVPNLAILETVTSVRLADEVQKVVKRMREAKEREDKLRIFVQVNTSGEDTKGGILPNESVDVVNHIISKCPDLEFGGLMTIGRPSAPEDQPDFTTLIQCRKEVAEALNKEEKDFELSMGMSADFKEAIKFGSTNVRVGSTIFGARPPFKPKN